MDEKLSREDLAVMIRARQLSKKIGLAPDANIKTICEHAGISRKTGYQWAEKFCGCSACNESQLAREFEQLKAEHEGLKKDLSEVRIENEGHKIAWEIHEVNELLAKKKALRPNAKEKSREFFQRTRFACTQVRLGSPPSREHLDGLEQSL